MTEPVHICICVLVINLVHKFVSNGIINWWRKLDTSMGAFSFFTRMFRGFCENLAAIINRKPAKYSAISFRLGPRDGNVCVT